MFSYRMVPPPQSGGGNLGGPRRLACRLVCLVVGHAGQVEGGTLVFFCPRCRGAFFQHEDLRHVNVVADEMIAEGRHDDALRYAQAEVHRRAGQARGMRRYIPHAGAPAPRRWPLVLTAAVSGWMLAYVCPLYLCIPIGLALGAAIALARYWL
jgi:hypothetical protein